MYSMEEGLKVGGKVYVSSRRLSEKYGYTIDHISRLCRKGRVKGALVSRAWFVDEEDFLFYTKINGRSGHQEEVSSKEDIKKWEEPVKSDADMLVPETKSLTKGKTQQYRPATIISPTPFLFGKLRHVILFLLFFTSVATAFTALHPATRDSFTNIVEGEISRTFTYLDTVTGGPLSFMSDETYTTASVGNTSQHVIDTSAIYVYETISGFLKRANNSFYALKNNARKKIIAWLNLGDAAIVYQGGTNTVETQTNVREKVTT